MQSFNRSQPALLFADNNRLSDVNGINATVTINQYRMALYANARRAQAVAWYRRRRIPSTG
jgi:hypothetical protein